MCSQDSETPARPQRHAKATSSRNAQQLLEAQKSRSKGVLRTFSSNPRDVVSQRDSAICLFVSNVVGVEHENNH